MSTFGGHGGLLERKREREIYREREWWYRTSYSCTSWRFDAWYKLPWVPNWCPHVYYLLLLLLTAPLWLRSTFSCPATIQQWTFTGRPHPMLGCPRLTSTDGHGRLRSRPLTCAAGSTWEWWAGGVLARDGKPLDDLEFLWLVILDFVNTCGIPHPARLRPPPPPQPFSSYNHTFPQHPHYERGGCGRPSRSPFRGFALDPVILPVEPMSHGLRDAALPPTPPSTSFPTTTMWLMHRGPVAPVYPGKQHW